MNTTILLVRHADVHNPREVIYGRLPRFRLSKLGEQQARHLAELLSVEPIAAIYTSPQLRARQTARFIARYHTGVPLIVSSLLAEVLTAWQGAPNSQAGPDIDFYATPREPGDETLEQVSQRMRRFVARTLLKHPGQSVVAVSHGDPIAILRLAVTGSVPTLSTIRESTYPGKTSITRLEYSPERELLSVEYVDPTHSQFAGR